MEGVIRVLGGQGPQGPVGGGGGEAAVAAGGEAAALHLGPALTRSVRSDNLLAVSLTPDNLLPPPDRLFLQLSDVLPQGPEVYRLVAHVLAQDLLYPRHGGEAGARGDPVTVSAFLVLRMLTNSVSVSGEAGARGALVPLLLGRAAPGVQL